MHGCWLQECTCVMCVLWYMEGVSNVGLIYVSKEQERHTLSFVHISSYLVRVDWLWLQVRTCIFRISYSTTYILLLNYTNYTCTCIISWSRNTQQQFTCAYSTLLGGIECGVRWNPVFRTLQSEDTSINRTHLAVPNSLFVSITTTEIRTPH